jgi:hypothetical protein
MVALLYRTLETDNGSKVVGQRVASVLNGNSCSSCVNFTYFLDIINRITNFGMTSASDLIYKSLLVSDYRIPNKFNKKRLPILLRTLVINKEVATVQTGVRRLLPNIPTCSARYTGGK